VRPTPGEPLPSPQPTRPAEPPRPPEPVPPNAPEPVRPPDPKGVPIASGDHRLFYDVYQGELSELNHGEPCHIAIVEVIQHLEKGLSRVERIRKVVLMKGDPSACCPCDSGDNEQHYL
jgi:hypothetical protein